MKKLYSHENRLQVYHCKNLLDLEQIPNQVKNEYVGGAVGDLSPFDTWLELWVKDQDYDQAQRIIEQYSQTSSSQSKICPNCGAVNEAQFHVCWNCQVSLY